MAAAGNPLRSTLHLDSGNVFADDVKKGTGRPTRRALCTIDAEALGHTISIPRIMRQTRTPAHGRFALEQCRAVSANLRAVVRTLKYLNQIGPR